jgi:hypothetical protein
VTSQGSAYNQFKRALDRRNFLLAWTMAAELPKVPLADALSLLLLARSTSNHGATRKQHRAGTPGYATRLG